MQSDAAFELDKVELDPSAGWALVHQDWSARAELGQDDGRPRAVGLAAVSAGIRRVARWLRPSRGRSANQVI